MKYPTRKAILVGMKPNTHTFIGGRNRPFCGRNVQKHPSDYSSILSGACDALEDAVPSILSPAMRGGAYYD